ncbi:MAG: sterol desaturase family protein [Kofleriaceae bacterium]|nr:sterol desaturase family protein [Myxococcales bacterium]MCB9574579.1 sterol desaturase family protein [Kofleriaceae bacterium]
MSWTVLTPIVIVAGALIIIALERVRPYDRGQPFLRRGLWLDLVWYGLAQSYVLALVIHALVAWVDRATGASSHGLVAGWPIAAQVALFVVSHDLYIYGFHRLQHRNRYLWRLHEAHHSAKAVDWIAGSRSHALEILINQSIEFGAMILLGADPDVILIKGAISALWGMWIHANVDVRSGWLQYLINGPEMHRWHHAIDYPGDGANYGTKLALWDYLFGTVYRPARKPAGYGLADPFPTGYLAQHVHAFRRFDRVGDPAPPAAGT